MKKNKVDSTSTLKPMLPLSPPWLELPEDVTAKILHQLGPIGILVDAQEVCSRWRKICRDPTMWRVIDMWKLDENVVDIYELNGDGLEVLCRLAVDLSQGQVTEINIDNFGSDALLEYIGERCGNLRCLCLAYCEDVSGRSLCKAVKGFPLLEELHLQCTPVEKHDIEAIGQSCPMLKTFALNCRDGMELCEEALGVATSMPELRHLQLFGNRITNEMLESILNGCPKLESLDLRHCFDLNLAGELGKRCAQQIKILRRPHDPTDDYKWDFLLDDFHEIVNYVDFEDDSEDDDDYEDDNDYEDDDVYEDDNDYEDDDDYEI